VLPSSDDIGLVDLIFKIFGEQVKIGILKIKKLNSFSIKNTVY